MEEEDPPFQILVFLILLWIWEGHEEDREEDPPPDLCPPCWRRMTIRRIQRISLTVTVSAVSGS